MPVSLLASLWLWAQLLGNKSSGLLAAFLPSPWSNSTSNLWTATLIPFLFQFKWLNGYLNSSIRVQTFLKNDGISHKTTVDVVINSRNEAEAFAQSHLAQGTFQLRYLILHKGWQPIYALITSLCGMSSWYDKGSECLWIRHFKVSLAEVFFEISAHWDCHSLIFFCICHAFWKPSSSPVPRISWKLSHGW